MVSKLNTKSGFKKVYIIEQAREIGYLNPNKKVPVLFDLTFIKKVSVDDIYNLFTEENYEVASRIGVLLNSSVQKMIISAWLVLQGTKVPCPVQIFNKEGEAKAWISSFED